MSAVFAGRQQEQRAFEEWLNREPTDERRVSLLLGHTGSGKSALLRQFEHLAIDHKPERWFAQLIELNGSESASEFLERVLLETHRLLRGRFLSRGPRDARLLQGLLKAIPKIGDLLAELVDEDKRPGWLRFIDYCTVVSEGLRKKNDRLILLIDPDREMNPDQPEDWLSVAKRLPERIRVVIAQRPTDALASHVEARRVFHQIPKDGPLNDLDAAAVSDWYGGEMLNGRLAEIARTWPRETRDTLAPELFKRVGGFAYAHESAIRLLVSERPEQPITCTDAIMGDLHELVEVQFESLARQGGERLRASLALRTFTVPTTRELWARATGMKLEDLTANLSDRHYLAYFTGDDDNRYAVFHWLFAERLELELSRNPQLANELAEKAWEALETKLSNSAPDRLVADPNDLVAMTAVAARFKDIERVTRAVGLVLDAKDRLNMLDAYEADVRLVLQRAQSDALISARFYNALGHVHERRRDPAAAEESYRTALNLGGATVQLPPNPPVKLFDSIQALRREAGEACRNLARVYHDTGRGEEAEAMLTRVVMYQGNPRTLSDTVRSFGEQGFAQAELGNLAAAEMMFRSARAAAKQFGDASGFETSCLNLGVVYIKQDRPSDAERVLKEALASARSRRAGRSEAQILYNLGVLYSDGGETEKARESWERALQIHIERGETEKASRLRAIIDGLPHGSPRAPE